MLPWYLESSLNDRHACVVPIRFLLSYVRVKLGSHCRIYSSDSVASADFFHWPMESDSVRLPVWFCQRRRKKSASDISWQCQGMSAARKSGSVTPALAILLHVTHVNFGISVLTGNACVRPVVLWVPLKGTRKRNGRGATASQYLLSAKTIRLRPAMLLLWWVPS